MNIDLEISPRQTGKTTRLLKQLCGRRGASFDEVFWITPNSYMAKYVKGLASSFVPNLRLDIGFRFISRMKDIISSSPPRFMVFDEFAFNDDAVKILNWFMSVQTENAYIYAATTPNKSYTLEAINESNDALPYFIRAAGNYRVYIRQIDTEKLKEYRQFLSHSIFEREMTATFMK